MPFRSLVLVALVIPAVLTGCSKSPRDQLQGKWVGESVGRIHPQQSGAADAWAKGTHLELSGNKVTLSLPAESPRSGTFKVAKMEGKDMEVVFRRAGETEDKTRMRVGEDGRLVWTLATGQELVMRRE